ncbi:hypothetical protein DFH07DRAFT_768477 [Mycena maculata]|uniref:Uncharacterized protein n=1 Tax=Mycena maculata TaxID=230809 RepID=A0AAD7JUY0_9AGAR|nr:hypothetical protein DFH07DRAFT_768477 [Mycena maculata]
MFSMTLYKCGVAPVALGPERTPVITFLRDGVFWFLALILTSIVEIILWVKARPTLAQIPVVPATGLIAVIGARVVLNIKHVACNTDIDAATYTAPTDIITHRPVRHPEAQRVLWYLRTTDTINRGADTTLLHNYRKNFLIRIASSSGRKRKSMHDEWRRNLG